MKILSLVFILCSMSFAKDLAWPQDLAESDLDTKVFLNQSKSTIDWDRLDIGWLDFHNWKEEREFKDKNPLWKLKLREFKVREKIGAVIKCVGECYLESGIGPKKVEFNSALFEGDEIKTKHDSLMWVVLANGSIVRLSQNTTLALGEINFNDKSNFLYLRLNEGHIYYEKRTNSRFTPLNLPETDQSFWPLAEAKANREFYSIFEYRRISKESRATYEAERNPGAFTQYKALNKMIEDDSNYLSYANSKVILNTASYTVQFSNGNYNFFYKANSESYIGIRNRSFNVEEKETGAICEINLRDSRVFKKLKSGTYKVNKTANRLIKVANKFKISELNIKRIPTIQMAREIILRRKFPFLFKAELNKEKMITEYGYALWDNDKLEKRIAELHEVIFEREIKTLDLTKRFIQEKDIKLEDTFIAKNIMLKANHYKLRNSFEYKKIRRFSNFDYFVWVMENGR